MRKSARLERLTCLAFWLAAAGCQSRAVSDAGPSGRSTSNSEDAAAGGRTFAAVPESKVDLLFDIDNSATMGAKQTYLEQAIPELIARLVTPRCIDEATGQPSGTNADPTTGACSTGSTAEFARVHDMHIGVVTSSLGPRLGDVCTSTTTVVSSRASRPPRTTTTTGTSSTAPGRSGRARRSPRRPCRRGAAS